MVNQITALETAAHPENLRRVAIEPVSRVKGHGKVTLLLDKVYPLHEVAKIDYFSPGYPSSRVTIWKFLTDLIAGKTLELEHEFIKYD